MPSMTCPKIVYFPASLQEARTFTQLLESGSDGLIHSIPFAIRNTNETRIAPRSFTHTLPGHYNMLGSLVGECCAAG